MRKMIYIPSMGRTPLSIGPKLQTKLEKAGGSKLQGRGNTDKETTAWEGDFGGKEPGLSAKPAAGGKNIPGGLFIVKPPPHRMP